MNQIKSFLYVIYWHRSCMKNDLKTQQLSCSRCWGPTFLTFPLFFIQIVTSLLTEDQNAQMLKYFLCTSTVLLASTETGTHTFRSRWDGFADSYWSSRTDTQVLDFTPGWNQFSVWLSAPPIMCAQNLLKHKDSESHKEIMNRDQQMGPGIVGEGVVIDLRPEGGNLIRRGRSVCARAGVCVWVFGCGEKIV